MFCIEGLQSMKGTEALNFMMLTHEIMTRYVISDKSSKVLNYLISGPVISQLFQILQKNQCMYLLYSTLGTLQKQQPISFP
jgi:hypothetical protein